ncbi:amidohydrolase family protein [Maribacter antarcticus]|uniref:amidohydrolase family protein n=1 Tax=Maribacter antarcticus TaxID=505250 RepID=UPI00047E0F44|nr:amidohydrolase family protein [Maribacter antarcticus]
MKCYLIKRSQIINRTTVVIAVLFFTLLPGKIVAQELQKTVLTNCNIIDCTGAELQKDMTVILNGNKISEIKKGKYTAVSNNKNTQILDLEGAYVVPGLWNMHTHLAALLPDPKNIQANESVISASIRAGLNAMDGLRHGFTSVRSVGERDYIDVEWRTVFDQGFFMGPRIFASGDFVSPTAGHRGYVEKGADGVAEMRKLVRQRVQKGVDLIKIFSVEMLQDELEAAIETAHSLGRHVTTHTREPDIYRAVKAGIDCIEHGYGITDETIELMAKKGTFYDPTIICNLSDEYIKEREYRLKTLGYAEDEKISYYRTLINYADERSPAHAMHQRRALKKAVDVGVKVVLGSDSMPIGEMGVLEMEQFVLSGVSEMNTLIAATRNCADLLGVLDKLGTVEEGKLADLLIVAKNPLENISYIREVKMVFKEGISVDLNQPSGTASYWDYFSTTDLKKGFLKEAENAAGFQRGKTKE